MAGNWSARIIGGASVGVGILHFVRQDFFEAMVPRWFPDPKAANLLSGGAEIALGLAMFPRRTRRRAAWGLLGLIVAVYPANIDMYLHDVDIRPDQDGRIQRVEGSESARTRNLLRLPLQFVFAWLVWRHTREETAR
ncbi:MAG: hypothetical protein GWN79_01075 [Actinobacteria bacterium]|nr:hypothetical protein [Actinomycetota bacterium]NIS28761.1 hypothetical protein [Actinomycetota bacterium]NIT94147.1 hypothetical protein [Actinomycetota bacterium]NIU17767.1 hypothetical protein [Actinomycetota bacterium]NIU64223.1 hypothetical protein [Actinomycetota bacterium]